MHNCKTTRERATELLLDGSDPRAVLSRELRECRECREELAALDETLLVTTRFIETAAPPESYWPAYHARLKQKLSTTSINETPPSWSRRLFTSSIRVPVPVGIAAMLLVTLAFIFSIRVPAEPKIVQVPVEVPVIQEKTVERIVYREKPAKRPKRIEMPARQDSTLASLEGFKPTDEIKLTVIKGGAANEK